MAVPSDPAAALLMREITFNPPQGGGSQVNTGPAAPVNSNPVSGNLVTAAGAATATAPISPGAVGYVDKALPYSPGTTYTANVQNNVAGVNTPAIPLPANGAEQVSLGNSVINRAFPQWAPGGEAGLVTAKQG